VFVGAKLTNANLKDAFVNDALFWHAKDLTSTQFYATASFLNRNLTGVGLQYLDVSGWNFQHQDLRDANFLHSNLTGADLSNARIEGVTLVETIGLTPEQVYSTRSYRQSTLQGVSLLNRELESWDFSHQNLSFADLQNTNLTDADLSYATLDQTEFLGSDLTRTDFSHADVRGADFRAAVRIGGLTTTQIYATRSFAQHDLRRIRLDDNDLSGWDLSGQDLMGASFRNSRLADTDLSGALIEEVDFYQSDISFDQIASTESYRNGSLKGVDLRLIPLVDWDLRGQNLSNSILGFTPNDCCDLPPTIRNVDLSGATLNNAWIQNFEGDADDFATIQFSGADLSSANLATTSILSEAIVDSSTVYNQWTLFPQGFDPVARGLKFVPTPTGDFDGNHELTVEDIDLLLAGIRLDDEQERYDVNSDAQVNFADMQVWIHDLQRTWFGDADLNGQFDSADLVAVLSAGEYEDWGYRNSTWSTGDWNADGEFTSSDLVVALADGGYEQGPREAMAVPEQSSLAILIVGLIVVASVPKTRRNPL
jgi:uncharacterized protein YjbI with pentapeptide repeats